MVSTLNAPGKMYVNNMPKVAATWWCIGSHSLVLTATIKGGTVARSSTCYRGHMFNSQLEHCCITTSVSCSHPCTSATNSITFSEMGSAQSAVLHFLVAPRRYFLPSHFVLILSSSMAFWQSILQEGI